MTTPFGDVVIMFQPSPDQVAPWSSPQRPNDVARCHNRQSPANLANSIHTVHHICTILIYHIYIYIYITHTTYIYIYHTHHMTKRSVWMDRLVSIMVTRAKLCAINHHHTLQHSETKWQHDVTRQHPSFSIFTLLESSVWAFCILLYPFVLKLVCNPPQANSHTHRSGSPHIQGNHNLPQCYIVLCLWVTYRGGVGKFQGEASDPFQLSKP